MNHIINKDISITQISEVLNSSMSNKNLNYNFNNSLIESKRQKINLMIENNKNYIEELFNKETSHQKIKNILDNNYNERKQNTKLTNSLISDKNVKNIKYKSPLRRKSKEKFKFISETNLNSPSKNQNPVDIIELSKSYTKSKNILYSKIMLLDLKRKSNFPFTKNNHNFDINEEDNLTEHEINFEDDGDSKSDSSVKNNEVKIETLILPGISKGRNLKIDIMEEEQITEITEYDEKIKKIKSINIL